MANERFKISWYDPILIVNNGSNQVLPGIHVCCMHWGMGKEKDGLIGRFGFIL